jgi:AraC family transcriptional activator FtrA
MPNPTGSTQGPLVVALAYDGLCLFEFGIAYEVFGLPRPEAGDGWYRFAVAAVDPPPLRTWAGVAILADGGPALLRQAHTIVVPGWRGIEEEVPAALIASLREAHGQGARVMSLCSGIKVLAAAGLLNGRRATTHWRYADPIRRAYPAVHIVPDVLYVEDGNVLTAAGSAAGIDLCLHVVRRDFGPAMANEVARRLVVPPHRDGGQAQFVPLPVPVERVSPRLGGVIDWMRRNLDQPHTIAALARRAGMSARTFQRRFAEVTGVPPHAWLTRERLARACELLEENRASLEDIAVSTGFGSAATMRHHFRKQLRTSPAAYRARFNRQPVGPAFVR